MISRLVMSLRSDPGFRPPEDFRPFCCCAALKSAQDKCFRVFVQVQTRGTHFIPNVCRPRQDRMVRGGVAYLGRFTFWTGPRYDVISWKGVQLFCVVALTATMQSGSIWRQPVGRVISHALGVC